ncbi:MAG: ribbon-helix-helix domain-containing protein [Rhodospirillaceae bacterium]
MSQDTPSQPGSAVVSEENDGTADRGTRTQVRGLRSHNIVVDGKRTSIRLDPVSLASLSDIAARERISVNDLCTMIESHNRGNAFTFTAAIRIFLLSYYKAAATEEGHQHAGHGSNQPLAGTPFGEPDLLKLDPATRKAGRGRPPQGAKPRSTLDGRAPVRPGETAAPDLPAG